MDAVRPSFAALLRARERLRALSLCAPLVPLNGSTADSGVNLKLENLQPVGSFKLRPVGNAVLSRTPATLAAGLFTCSSGNSGVALAWMARRLGLAATVVVPAENTPAAKLELLQALGARVVKETFPIWWRSVESMSHPAVAGVYIDAVRDPQALAGNGTAGLEILEQMPDVEAIFVPFGGGSLACGIASAVRELKPAVKVIACELESAQPFSAARRAGKVVSTPSQPGFVSGVGFDSMLAEMWPLASALIDGALTVSLAQVAAAIKLLAERNKVIAEGAGAIPVAAAVAGRHPYQRVCAVVSGGNLGNDILSTILAGGIPG
jgi:threonine dehydratase